MTIAQQAGKTQPQAKRITLAQVSRQRITKPWSVLLYGTEKIGKTTWAAQAPSPIFITPEDGLSEIVNPDTGENPAHFPQPETWQDVIDCIDLLANEKHEHKTIVIDTIDWLEPLLWRHLFDSRKTDGNSVASSIEDYGYGKGYNYAVDVWRVLVSKLERCMANGMNVCLLGHSQVKPFNNPEGVNFDRYTLKVNQKAGDFLKEWVKAILFVNYEILAHKGKGDSKAKAVGEGARVVHTQRRPAFDAGNRYGLPAEMQFDFAEFDGYVTGRLQSERAASLRKQLTDLLTSTTLEPMLGDALTKAGNNTTELEALINRATIKLGEQS